VSSAPCQVIGGPAPIARQAGGTTLSVFETQGDRSTEPMRSALVAGLENSPLLSFSPCDDACRHAPADIQTRKNSL
ncbi:MAG: hypothetical protein RLO21_11870, partial [Nitratireductor sp.]